jgi:hypothetical protein
MKQSFKNHTRWYVPHHFIYYPILLLLTGYSIYNAVTSADTDIWVMISAILLFLFWLAFMLRQHYALTLQDRLAKTELRYRYFSLTGQRLEQFEPDLSHAQLLALRFAGDGELAALVKRSVDENLTATEIKKSIVNWKGDYERV